MLLHKAIKQSSSVIFIRLLWLLIPLLAVLAYWSSSEAGSSGSYTMHPIVHFFSPDSAPMDGEISIFINYGSENKPEGWRMANWDISEGQHIDKHIKLTAKRYARVWFNPDNSDDWYLVPSQYWDKGGSCKDEFGISTTTSHPSYHTFFENMVHQDNVPNLKRLDDCPFGSSSYGPQAPTVAADGDSEPEPTPTPAPTPAPTATPCIILRQGGNSPCNSYSALPQVGNGLFFPDFK